MAPPGRRRSLYTLSLAFCVLVFFATTTSAVSAVLGIDLGTEYIKAALVKPGIPLEIVLTKDSKRKEASAVAFKPSNNAKPGSTSFPERVYGSDALALAARFPADVYPNLKPLLGKRRTDLLGGRDIIDEYKLRHPALETTIGEERATIGFKSQAFSEQQEAFSVEELLAMELKSIKANAEAMAGGNSISDAVVTVPAFFTSDERRAVELAADLAGLRTLSLVSDGLAVGINYATSRTFPNPAEGGKPEYHLVFDMGAGSTTATVLRFQGKTVKDVGRFNKTIQEVSVLGTGWDQTLGGDALNGVLIDDIILGFVASPKFKALDLGKDGTTMVKRNGRSSAKLWKEAERVRQVLSANSETVASFESLFEDLDFRYKVNRAKFEKLTASFVDRVTAPVEDALDVAKLTIEDLDSIILHGGAARTPFVQKKLEALAGSAKIRSNVNADEAAVFGAAFQGASLSPSFRVKDIRIGEAAGFAVKAQWDKKPQKLFTPTSLLGTVKSVSIKHKEDFSISFKQDIYVSESLNGQINKNTRSAQSEGTGTIQVEIPISRVETKNLSASVAQLTEKYGCLPANISTEFTIRLSPMDGLPEVIRGSVSCDVVADVDKKGGVVDEVKGFFGFGSRKSAQEPLENGEEVEEAASISVEEAEASTSTSIASSTTTEVTASPSAASKKSKEGKKRREIIYIDFTTIAEGLEVPSPGALQRMKDRLAALDESDRSRALREDTRNSLEGYIYRYRDTVDTESFVKASTEDERTRLNSLLSGMSDWLYGAGADANREELKTKLEELQAIITPVESRQQETIKRPGQIKLLQEALDQTKSLIDVIKAQVEQAASLSSSLAAEPSTVATATSSSASDEVDEFAELEDPTSGSTIEPAKPSKAPEIPPFTQEDVTAITELYERIQAWLSEKETAQEKLSAFEDPVLLVREIETKAKELNAVAIDLVSRKTKGGPKPKKPKGSPRPKKAKSKKSTSKPTSKPTAEEGSKGGESNWAEKMAKEAKDAPYLNFKPGEVPTQEQIMEALEKVKAEEAAKEKEKGRHEEL